MLHIFLGVLYKQAGGSCTAELDVVVLVNPPKTEPDVVVPVDAPKIEPVQVVPANPGETEPDDEIPVNPPNIELDIVVFVNPPKTEPDVVDPLVHQRLILRLWFLLIHQWQSRKIALTHRILMHF